MKTLSSVTSLALLMFGMAGVPAHAGPMNQQGVTTETFLFTDASGAQWQQTRTDTWTLNYVQVAGTSPAVVPVPVPVPVPNPTPDPLSAAVFTGLRDASRNWLPAAGATLRAGSLFEIEGAGFGTAGTVVLAPGAVPLKVMAWGPLEITVVVPPVTLPVTGPLTVTLAGGPSLTSTPVTFSP